jgi:hypothetical protein
MKDCDILENNYRIERIGPHYFGYKLTGDNLENSVCNANTLGWTKYHLINKELELKYVDASKAKEITLEKDTHDSNFVELIDKIFNLISLTLENEKCTYYCSYFIEGRPPNDVFKCIEYLNYKKFKTFLTSRELIISWA